MKAYWVIGIVMAAGLRAQSPDCTVNVYVESGPMPVGMLSDAKVKATQMFRGIGLNVPMRNGIPSHEPGDGCGAPIVVKLENLSGYRGGSDALAYAEPYKRSGTCIHVFIDRLMLRLDHDAFFSNALLAHVMVHEITHVLEGFQRHSDEGVRKAAWSEHDYESMKRHALPFTPDDVDLIRRGLAKRVARATAH